MKAISSYTQRIVKKYLDAGNSLKFVAQKVGIGIATANRIQKMLVPERKKHKPGRKEKLSCHDKRSIVRSITSGDLDDAVELRKKLQYETGTIVCLETIRNMLKKDGL